MKLPSCASDRMVYRGDWPYRWECWLLRGHKFEFGGNARCKRCGAIYERVTVAEFAAMLRKVYAAMAEAYEAISGASDLPRVPEDYEATYHPLRFDK